MSLGIMQYPPQSINFICLRCTVTRVAGTKGAKGADHCQAYGYDRYCRLSKRYRRLFFAYLRSPYDRRAVFIMPVAAVFGRLPVAVVEEPG